VSNDEFRGLSNSVIRLSRLLLSGVCRPLVLRWMNRGEVGDAKGRGDDRDCEEVESRLMRLEPILLWMDDADGSMKLVVMGEVARGVVEWER
jgi:hypothetical protein